MDNISNFNNTKTSWWVFGMPKYLHPSINDVAPKLLMYISMYVCKTLPKGLMYVCKISSCQIKSPKVEIHPFDVKIMEKLSAKLLWGEILFWTLILGIITFTYNLHSYIVSP